jgi:hypothetical protein
MGNRACDGPAFPNARQHTKMPSFVSVIVHASRFREGLTSMLAKSPFEPACVAASPEHVPGTISVTDEQVLVLIGVREGSNLEVVRAEPIAALYETGRVHHVGHFPELEDQLVAFSTHGYLGDGSPDRADALIWSLTELFPCVVASEMPFEKKPEVLGSLLWRRRSLTEMAKSCAEVADEIVDLINR